MSFSQLFKIVVMIGPMQSTFKGRFPSITEALAHYSRMGRVIEIKEVSK